MKARKWQLPPSAASNYAPFPVTVRERRTLHGGTPSPSFAMGGVVKPKPGGLAVSLHGPSAAMDVKLPPSVESSWPAVAAHVGMDLATVQAQAVALMSANMDAAFFGLADAAKEADAGFAQLGKTMAEMVSPAARAAQLGLALTHGSPHGAVVGGMVGFMHGLSVEPGAKARRRERVTQKPAPPETLDVAPSPSPGQRRIVVQDDDA